MKYKSLLKAAVQKYGVENFTFILLEECETTKEALESVEQKYIDLLKPEYNILADAYSGVGNKSRQGQKQSEEEKQKHREAAKRLMSDPNIRAKISRAMTGVKKNYDVHTKGKPRPEETRQRIREGHQGSVKTKAYAERRRGRTNPSRSTSGEYGVRWRSEIGKWVVKIEGKNYGAFAQIEDAVVKRDYILSLDPSQRIPNKVGTPKSKSGGKVYGHYTELTDAINRRNMLMQMEK